MSKKDFDPDQLFDSETDIHGKYGVRGPSGAAFDKFDEAMDILKWNAFSSSDDMNSAINTLDEMGVGLEGLPSSPYVGDVPPPAPMDQYDYINEEDWV